MPGRSCWPDVQQVGRAIVGLREAARPWKGTAAGRDLDEIFAL